ncbi:MAG: sigma-54-dependent Fis family transcriptional regulator [candidate division Zixibacteria bacterium]|nr:sigma-54-dependent Fis family transcriptional regulator [candidate division Zixibacteria bacterium]
MYPFRILIVDDELSQREMLSGYLKKKGFKPSAAASGEEAVSMAENQSFEIALLDLRLPGIDGIGLLKRLHDLIPDISAVMITAHGDVHSAVEAMKSGAVDYLNKPIELEELLTIIKKAGERFRILSENRALKELIKQGAAPTDFVGESEEVKQLLSTVYRVAETDSTILVTGESGTGKELISSMIHKASPRAGKPFIPVACGALPETLLESELFGHEKGAFTGAQRLHLGRFELASGGTLFLDEIGELPSSVQAKLLRVLEENRIIRVGGEDYVDIDTRIVAATNRNLEKEIDNGNFRKDLYFRLNVIQIHIPSLKERRKDIIPLTEYFINRYSKRFKKVIEGITAQARDILLEYDWSGNVRELENCIERAVVLCTGSSIDTNDIPSNITGNKNSKIFPSDIISIKDAEKYLIKKALDKNDWNITLTASELGLHRNTLSVKIKEYNIK